MSQRYKTFSIPQATNKNFFSDQLTATSDQRATTAHWSLVAGKLVAVKRPLAKTKEEQGGSPERRSDSWARR
ncbi:hypothetical protein AGMMS4956_00280 [Bacteroidia bacterium]|nr:hypothetical protein AGMMS4956_00280 [Bacteroidia bacterium]